jgi:hypothetical protein
MLQMDYHKILFELTIYFLLYKKLNYSKYKELILYNNKLITNIEDYKPRDFILENLSMEVCENKLIETINNLNCK